jgi:RNA polymerase sigma factor (sigma-70 family)
MKLQVKYKNVSKAQQSGVTDELKVLSGKHLERHLSRFEPDLVEFRAILESSGHHKNQHRVALRLTIPGGLLTSQSDGDSLTAAAKEAFAELEQRLIERLERMRGEDEWRRKERRQQLHRLKAALAGQSPEERNLFAQRVRSYLPMLTRLVRFELKQFRARGALTENDLMVEDVVDEVLARAYRKLDRHQEASQVLHFLLTMAVEVLTEEARRSRARNRTLSLEGPPPREPTDLSIDETIYDFYQPDDLVRVEDLTPAPSEDPEEALSQKEIQHHFASMLANMPANWRRAVMLTRVEGLPLEEVARILSSSEAQVRQWLANSDDYLKAQLAELGNISSGKAPPLSYIAKPQTTPSGLERELDEALSEAAG